MKKSEYTNPVFIIASGIAASFVLWGLAQILPAIAESAVILWQGFVVSFGLAIAAATTGFATAGAISLWVPKIASAGIAMAGASVTFLVINKIVQIGKKNPFEWLLPALGLLAIFCVDLTKDQLLDNVMERALYVLITGVLTIGGGILLFQKHILLRIIGFILPFIPSVAIWVFLVREKHANLALIEFISSGSTGAIGLIGVFIFGLLIAILGFVHPLLTTDKNR